MFKSICTLAVVLLSASFAQADITNWYCAPDGDGAIEFTSPTIWAEPQATVYDLGMTAVQTNELYPAAHMAGWFDTNDDPTIRTTQTIDNETDFAWTGYEIKFAMDHDFTVVGASTYGPAGWSTGWSTPVYGSVPFESTVATGWYTTFTYTGGPQIDIGDTGEFKYAINYTLPTGTSAIIHFSTQQTALPEPAGLLLLGLGGLVLIRRR